MQKIVSMSYFNYHATAKKLIVEGKLKTFYFTKKHHSISPALILCFNDSRHPVMPIRKERFLEYLHLIKIYAKLQK
jgi:hypothetical protein